MSAITEWRVKRKDDWRRWMWNRIYERVPSNRRRSATALYLPGIDDAERPEAIKRGFQASGLVGIEMDADTRAHLRKQGVLTVAGNVFDVLLAWPDDWKIDVLSLDFCGGMGIEHWRLFDALFFRKAFDQCVVAINMRRGRDHAISIDGEKHRGKLMVKQFLIYLHQAVHAAGELVAIPASQVSKTVARGGAYSTTIVEKAQDELLRRWRPQYFSYGSLGAKHIKMDSVVFSWDLAICVPEVFIYGSEFKTWTETHSAELKQLSVTHHPDIAKRLAFWKECARAGLADYMDRYRAQADAIIDVKSNIRGSISAVRAWRTRRSLEVSP